MLDTIGRKMKTQTSEETQTESRQEGETARDDRQNTSNNAALMMTQ